MSKKEKLRNKACSAQLRSSSKDRARLFTVVNAGSTRDNGLKLRVERFRLDIMRSFAQRGQSGHVQKDVTISILGDFHHLTG